MKILVTGSTGFVGAAVARQLAARDHELRLLVRAQSNRGNIVELDAEIAIGDLTDPQSLISATKGCDALYHVAADYRLWAKNPSEFYATNVEGTKALLLAAAEAGMERIVYTSSVAALGRRDDGAPADEQTHVDPAKLVGHYKRSKYEAEQAVLRLVADHGCPAVIVNPSTPIGPRDIKPTPTGRMIVQAANGHIPAYVDTGLNVVHVDDVAAGHLLAFANGKIGERYILGGRDMTLAEILTAVANHMGRKPPRFRLPHDLIMPIAHGATAWARVTGREPFVSTDAIRMARKSMYFSSAKAEREIGYTHRPPMEAIADALKWFREVGKIG